MKKLIIGIALFTNLLVSCKKSENTSGGAPNENKPNSVSTETIKDTVNVPVITFEQPDYDFGTIKQGEVVKHVFKFTNSGKTPLIIEQATASCGCTVPKWPKDPIKPGESGEIYAEFNSAGKQGVQKKTISIKANTNPDQTVISLTGTIESVK